MKAEGGDHSMINLSVQQVLSLWAHGTVLRSLTEMWYWVFLWALFSSLFVHGAAGVLMFVMLQRHKQGRLISVVLVSIGFLASVTGAMITTNRGHSGLLPLIVMPVTGRIGTVNGLSLLSKNLDKSGAHVPTSEKLKNNTFHSTELTVVKCSCGRNLQGGRKEHGPSGSVGVWSRTDITDSDYLLFTGPCHTMTFFQERLNVSTQRKNVLMAITVVAGPEFM
ncbi:transmembrane protein 170B isoform X1 [Ascaphus truei]|uniref:transmembrane protein 170B isoform X1 n=1 Tax=Ascaphus truei TaxID=8439 RepID=UPI003F5A3429